MSNRKPIIQDPISAMIREYGLRIVSVHAIKNANLLLVLLNHGKLEFALDEFKRLEKATDAQLSKYDILPDGAGVEWTALDEHLSLRGFLLTAMRDIVSRPVRNRSRRGKKVQA